MEQQLREAVGGERKMSELIAFLLQGRSSVLFACGFCWGAHIVLFCLLAFGFCIQWVEHHCVNQLVKI